MVWVEPIPVHNHPAGVDSATLDFWDLDNTNVATEFGTTIKSRNRHPKFLGPGEKKKPDSATESILVSATESAL
jgi:hypothetical protein